MRLGAQAVIGIAAVSIVSLAAAASNHATGSSGTIPAFTPSQQSALPGADWISPQGNLQAQRHSSLTNITPANVSGLKLAFSFVLNGPGYEPRPQIGQEAATIEYGGVLYNMDEYGRVYATNATTGSRLWVFEPGSANPPKSAAQTLGLPTARATAPASVRGATIGDGMVFAAEPYDQVVALDARTGMQIWAHLVANPISQMTLSEAPIYYDGEVIMATSGGDAGASCIVFALEAKTGKPLWHFNIIPSQKQAGYNTWSAPFFTMGGGASWASVAIDPNTNDVYVSTGNTIPYTGYQRGPGKEYYTAGTLAVNAQTGKLAWFYQEVHHDNWDADTTLGPMVYQGIVNGKKADAIIAVNRTGLLFELDAATGKPLFPAPETAVPTYAPANYYPTQPIPATDPIFPKVLDDPQATAFAGIQGPDGQPFIYHNTVAANTFTAAQPDGWYVKVSSNINGAMPSSVDPALGYAFFEGTNSVGATEELPPTEIPPVSAVVGNAVNGGVHQMAAPPALLSSIPQVAALNGSDLAAMNLNTGKVAWLDHSASTTPGAITITPQYTGGILTTASGLLFTSNGTAESAFDEKTGALLWTSSNPLADVPWGPPTTYMVNGNQYVVFEAGNGGLNGSPPGTPTTVYVYSL
jgi:alcohol dehydrogenase (cytochrome c)